MNIKSYLYIQTSKKHNLRKCQTVKKLYKKGNLSKSSSILYG